MCCQDTNTLSLPAPVIETLAQYRRLLDERGWDWGDEQIDLFRWTRFTKFGAVFAEYVGSSSGLGHLINQAQAQLLTARSFAAVVVLSVMAILLFALVSIVERRVDVPEPVW